MVLTWIFFIVLLEVSITYYLYRFFLRGFRHYFMNLDDKKQKLFSIFLAFAIVAPSYRTYGIWIILLCLFVVAEGTLDLLSPLVKKLLKDKRPKSVKHMYISGGLAIVFACMVFVTPFINSQIIVETDYTVYANEMIRPEGYKIALIGDLHFGSSMGLEKLQITADRIGKLQPDFVVLCGDIVDEATSKNDMPEVFSILGNIPTKYGVYYVYGNHDLQHYSSFPFFTREDVENALKSSRIMLLCDEATSINNELTLIGRLDRSVDSDRKSLAQLLDGVNVNTQIILFDHRPDELTEASNLEYDLVLSGHTHNGQLWPIGYLLKYINMSELSYGYKRYNEMDAVVTSGIGTWGYPIRTQGKTEFVIVNLLNR